MSIGEKTLPERGGSEIFGGGEARLVLAQPVEVLPNVRDSRFHRFALCYFNYKVFNDMLSWFAASLPHPGC